VNSTELLERVRATAHTHALWKPGERILVALSGGPDSVAMLHLLHKLRKSERLELGALHMNYGLRGAEADGDADFCRKLCARLQVPIYIRKPEQPAAGNVQDWAREERRSAFEKCMAAEGYTRLAVGHTADDRAETMVLQLMRGAGLERIGYLPPVSGATIRPLVELRRSDVMAYLSEMRAMFRTDRSNFAASYVRNRVRHELLPQLEDIFDVDATAALDAQADALSLDAEYIEAQAEPLWRAVKQGSDEFRLAIATLHAYHPALQLRVLRRMAAALGVGLSRAGSFRLLQLAGLEVGRRVELGIDVSAERGRDDIWIYRRQEPLAPVAVAIPGKTPLPDGSYLTVMPATAESPFPEGRFRVRMSLPESVQTWQMRPVRAGDRMVPFGMAGSRLLFDLLAEAGIPRFRRELVWVLTGDNEVYWAAGLRMAEAGRVRPDHRNVYEFVWSAETI